MTKEYPNIQKSLVSAIKLPVILLATFWTIAIVMWQTKGEIFFLFNFGYIGTSIAIGVGVYTFLPKKKKPIGRKIALFLVGLYMLGFLGVISSENMQLEGFFFYCLAGVFQAAAIHYAVAKIAGPLIFNRGWCGWACWTIMVLDLLPYTRSPGRVNRKWEWLRYLHFLLSLLLVLVLWYVFDIRSQTESTQFYWLLIGNVFYFGLGIALAIILRDNRAFCKYVCPITVLMKVSARFAMLKIDGDADKCDECDACVRMCPMDIRIPEYIKNGERVLSTECVFCNTCVNVCPKNALGSSFKFDVGGKELLRRQHN